jgi:protein gp37
VRTTPANWRKPLLWEREHEAFALANDGRRRRVFCASLADVFDNEVDPEWRRDLFRLISSTQHLDFLLLTKRIGNASKMLHDVARSFGMTWGADWRNVWLGATVVNQEEADRDIPKLLAVPAAKRFLSIEPMLGPVDLAAFIGPVCDRGSAPGPGGYGGVTCSRCDGLRTQGGCPGIDWIIAGGESGPNGRPMHPDWVRELRDECADAGVPFHFKQWGEWTPGENVKRVRGTVDTAFLHDDTWAIHPLNLATDHGHIDDQPDLYRVGKKAAGRLLDGIEHNGFPT